MNKYVVLIPAYNPSNKLIKLVEELKKLKFKIIIVNDGSDISNNCFKKLKEDNIILEYSENMGKGYALKYGINYYLTNLVNEYDGIITVDADYQHLPKDINKIYKDEKNNNDTIILGSRNFDSKKVPLPNRLGNKITSFIFKILYNKKIFDTQTGLRLIPNKYLNECLEIDSNRFEYEMQMLINFSNNKYNLEEIEIETVYYSQSESKFKKIIDSLKIYKILLKESFRFLVTSLLSSFLDIILFTIFLKIFVSLDDLAIIFSTFFARIIADFLNFNLTKYFVFNSKEDSHKILLKYYILSFAKMAMSAVLVLLISKFLLINKTVIKMFVDILIYFISYRIQKKHIFKT